MDQSALNLNSNQIQFMLIYHSEPLKKTKQRKQNNFTVNKSLWQFIRQSPESTIHLHSQQRLFSTETNKSFAAIKTFIRWKRDNRSVFSAFSRGRCVRFSNSIYGFSIYVKLFLIAPYDLLRLSQFSDKTQYRLKRAVFGVTTGLFLQLNCSSLNILRIKKLHGHFTDKWTECALLLQSHPFHCVTEKPVSFTQFIHMQTLLLWCEQHVSVFLL